jgi:glycosyltransferase involved in cell wall biosynthesis
MVAENQQLVSEFSRALQQPEAESLAGRRVLFISYNGMMDPLGQSQVLPYLRQLATQGVKFTLLSFEKPKVSTPEGIQQCETLKRELLRENIDWHWLRYHRTPSLPATAYDVLNGVRTARRLVKQKQIEMVHARSHIPATIGLALKKSYGIKLIFDIRGLMAEEYRDADHWREGSIPYRLTKYMEQRVLEAADGVVTLTERIWPIIRSWPGLQDRDVAHEVIPCCADLQRFNFSASDRSRRRQQLGLRDEFVIVYSGSIDGWYLTEEMADFCAFTHHCQPESHFLWLTGTNHERVRALMLQRGIDNHKFTIKSATAAEVPSYLSAADAGLAFIKPCFSKLASSPTKTAEYLACGLPLIINSGIGDADVLITEERSGALVTEFSDEEYSRALQTVFELLADRETTRTRSRKVAETLFNLETVAGTRYARLYEKVFQV